MDILIGIIVALAGFLGFNFIKRKSAEALLENVETKVKLGKVDKNIDANKNGLDSEEAKRNEILNKFKEAVNKNEDLDKFFNDRFNSDDTN